MAAELSLQIALYVAVGLLARRFRLVDEGFEKPLGNFLVNVALPCMIIRALRVQLGAGALLQCGGVLLLAAAVLAVGGAAGQLCYLLAGKNGRGRLFRFGLLVSNFTFLGMPVAELLLGPQGLFYFSVFTVPIRVFYYGAVELLLSPRPLSGSGGWKRALRSPPVLGVAAGILLAVTGAHLPGAVEAVIDGLGSACSPLGMLLCGLTIDLRELPGMLRPRYFLLPLLRVLAMPALFFVLAYPLPLPVLFKQIAVLYAALPCAGMLSAYTVRYDPDPADWAESSAYILLSTLLSVFTLPLWGSLITLF